MISSPYQVYQVVKTKECLPFFFLNSLFSTLSPSYSLAFYLFDCISLSISLSFVCLLPAIMFTASPPTHCYNCLLSIASFLPPCKCHHLFLLLSPSPLVPVLLAGYISLSIAEVLIWVLNFKIMLGSIHNVHDLTLWTSYIKGFKSRFAIL